MSASQLNPRSTRRIGRATGLGDEIIRAWSGGTYTHSFVTRDHRHGWYSLKTGEWGWFENDESMHYSSCRDLFPDHPYEQAKHPHLVVCWCGMPPDRHEVATQ